MARDNKAGKVLLVDDDWDILELLEYNLEKEGFKVKALEDSYQAISAAKEFQPDLIILDIMMPHPNGIEICRELRAMKRFEDTYIFFLTAKSESYYQEAAFETGGDDFIEKIIGLRALTYKVKTVLKRRFVIRKRVPELNIGELMINRRSHSVRIRDKEISLSKPEFELLFFFAQNPLKAISHENLLCNIWGSEIYMFDTSIDVYIDNLRAKIGDRFIQMTADRRFRFVPGIQW
ncbi:response regulator transcription factor [Chryseolinea sp. T2]|uniref:response regulator transcription factor n=1 Tax=Chryseolinea sp. T2 TaxID=3129255 RepID=UPI0030778396